MKNKQFTLYMCVYDLTIDEYFVGCLPDLQVTNKSKKREGVIAFPKYFIHNTECCFETQKKNNAATCTHNKRVQEVGVVCDNLPVSFLTIQNQRALAKL